MHVCIDKCVYALCGVTGCSITLLLAKNTAVVAPPEVLRLDAAPAAESKLDEDAAAAADDAGIPDIVPIPGECPPENMHAREGLAHALVTKQ